jgi:hypothetical protein
MSRTRGIPRLIVSMATTLAVTTATVVVIGTPAHAVDVPAYGVITITDPGMGTGFTTTWTYDPAFWSCNTVVDGQFNLPTAVTVNCRASEGMSFNCPRMILTTHTEGLASRAGGRAACTFSLDTGIISGANTAQRTGDLGHAAWVSCTAYSDTPLIPPYTVTCNEPGLPTL